ncbi:family 4 glycosyl hydrolase, alpha-galactosidase/6-phospho-beta-glucosidase [Sphaerochaeta pleomorpha str. Grapes]|uniref:Family 4 glycosyl hydrolase, alpha-galactosidase/6-phospho-beta-glucosidase n=1 Tax=Sphaerochaeta pleomorpha (strain ATCC BAA-1885 / DSM 22778 / Grapes) TaxID=158190 RepID=G8QXB3_SPHPG|nr:alpha-glucosidase [Sphaerochaeta pleomorpha]AEV28414.1 family 4 glycosyl hydrolase, alpha-galactosidase/6-phospho-beta-glucosidase [Sphaerochaeta pleomorpha str. Grapes]
MKIVLVGAGSAQFGYGMLGDIFTSKTLAGSEITLLDINDKALDSVFRTAKAFIEQHALKYSVHATTDRKVAFKNADFIISSIEVGNRFQLWDEDWKIPLQYGVHQVYGENGGPGGVFHSLRIGRVILEIVKDAVEICPDAWIFNFSNPMTSICTTVNRAYPEAKFVGMCHEIGWLGRWLPRMLNMKLEDLHFRAAGLNHFSCMLELTDRKTGKDLYPEVLKKAEAFFEREPGYSDLLDEYRRTGNLDAAEKFEKGHSDKKSSYIWADRHLVQFMLKNYRLLPITTDSHFGEYISWAWDVADHRGILDFYDVYKIMLTQELRHDIKLETAERVVPIIDGILNDSGYEEAAVNVQNNGLLEDLPSWIAVEVPAIINKDGVNGIKMPNIPKGYLSLLRSYTSVYDLTAEAIIHGKKDYVIQAMLANPVVHQASQIEAMVDRMIDQQQKWLGYLK